MTIQTVVNSMAVGETACLHVGTYAENVTYARNLAGFITVRSFPGELATWRPAMASPSHPLRVNEPGSRLRVQALKFTSGGAAQPASGGLIDSYGSFIEVLDSEITASADNGIYTDEASDHNSFLRNWIHHNGTVLDVNQDHGIYLQGDDHLVANNVIEDNSQGFGIQNYDYGRRVRILHNTISRNGHARGCCGGIVAGGGGSGAGGSGVAGAVIVNNLLVDNRNYGLSHDSQAPSSCDVHSNLSLGTGIQTSGWPGGCLGANFTSGTEVDRADPAFMEAPTFDDSSRPLGAGPDIGARER